MPAEKSQRLLGVTTVTKESSPIADCACRGPSAHRYSTPGRFFSPKHQSFAVVPALSTRTLCVGAAYRSSGARRMTQNTPQRLPVGCSVLAQDDPNLLTPPLSSLASSLVLWRGIDPQRWTAHTPSMRQTILHKMFVTRFSSGRRPSCALVH